MACFVHRNKKILIMFVIIWFIIFIKRPRFGTILWDGPLMSILLKIQNYLTSKLHLYYFYSALDERHINFEKRLRKYF